MIFGILSQIVFIGLIILGVRKLRAGSSRGEIRLESVRRFFQYLLLFGLVIVVANGLTGLLARLIESSDLLILDQSTFARNFTFVVVGLPLLIGMFMWIRRQFTADPSESSSFSWALYFTLSSLTLLIGASFGLRQSMLWAIGESHYQSGQLAQFIAWGAFWAGHWWLNARFTIKHNCRAHYLIGSLYGLIFMAVGLVQLLSEIFERAFDLDENSILPFHQGGLISGWVTLIVGSSIWFLYWVRTSSRIERDIPWLAYVLLIGVGGGLVMSITSLSTLLYSATVWWFGTPGTADAATHFRSSPTALSAALTGGFVWIYHRSLLHHGSRGSRTEIRRIYEYLMSAIGLIASSIGFAIILVSLVDAITEGDQISGEGSRNTLLAALTLLIVGGPLWGIYWKRIQLEVARYPQAEHSSPTRRIYLFLLFGVGGVASVVTLLVGTFMLFDDIFNGNFGQDTLRRIRIPIGLILATAAASEYHWLVYRGERVHYEAVTSQRRKILLVGAHNPQVAREIAERCNAQVDVRDLAGTDLPNWEIEDLIQDISAISGRSLLVLNSSAGVQIIELKT